MGNFTKFKKRVENLMIDDFKIYFSKMRNVDHHGDIELPFIIKYKDEIIFNKYREDLCDSWQPFYQIMDFIDCYFDLKHEFSFDKSADELIKLFESDNFNQKTRKYINSKYSESFKEKAAEELLTILKICDKRTGKRSLQKLKDTINNEKFNKIIYDRLNNK